MIDLKQENVTLKTLVRELEKKIDSIPHHAPKSTPQDRVFHKRDEDLLKQIVSEAMGTFIASTGQEFQDIRLSVQSLGKSVHEKVQALLDDKNRLTWEEHKARQKDIMTLNQEMFASTQKSHAEVSSMQFFCNPFC